MIINGDRQHIKQGLIIKCKYYPIIINDRAYLPFAKNNRNTEKRNTEREC